MWVCIVCTNVGTYNNNTRHRHTGTGTQVHPHERGTHPDPDPDPDPHPHPYPRPHLSEVDQEEPAQIRPVQGILGGGLDGPLVVRPHLGWG